MATRAKAKPSRSAPSDVRSECAVGVCNPQRTQGLTQGGQGQTVLVQLKGPGLFLAAERLLARPDTRQQPRMPMVLLGRAYTLLVVVTGWSLFRSDDLSQAARLVATACGAQAGDSRAYPLTQYLDGPLVVLHPGSGDNFQGRRWPAQSFARLADRLARDHGARVVVTGTRAEGGLAVVHFADHDLATDQVFVAMVYIHSDRPPLLPAATMWPLRSPQKMSFM